MAVNVPQVSQEPLTGGGADSLSPSEFPAPPAGAGNLQKRSSRRQRCSWTPLRFFCRSALRCDFARSVKFGSARHVILPGFPLPAARLSGSLLQLRAHPGSEDGRARPLLFGLRLRSVLGTGDLRGVRLRAAVRRGAARLRGEFKCLPSNLTLLVK